MNLLCEQNDFQSNVTNLQELLEEYNSLLNKIKNSGESLNIDWVSDSEKSFYELFLTKIAKLNELGKVYESLNALLKEINYKYEEIENDY